MVALSSLANFQTMTTTEQVYQALYSAIMTLELAPGSKVSEVEIAKSLGVSRQPVRDAFYRLSELGFLRIRPQRATTITYISEQALRDARFIRTAIEVECLRAAIANITDAQIAELGALIEQQSAAVDAGEKLIFHDLDDALHRRITEIAGHPSAWSLIRDQKVHLDRIRYLSLAAGAPVALEEHKKILAAIASRDQAAAEAHMREHLSRILATFQEVRLTHSEYFEDPDR